MPLFIHAADIHLDSPLRGLLQDEAAPDVEEIRGATRQALDNLINFVLSEKAPLLIIAGDLYDGDWQDFVTGLYFAKQMQRLAQAGVRVAVVRGNHDAANKMTKTLIMPENVKIFKARKPETWILNDLGLAVHGQSYASADVTENLSLAYPDPVPGMINIGVLHCLIAGSSGHMAYAPCTLDQLAAKGYDYWALGHVHKYAVLREQPFIIYPGCSQGRHIIETGEKGCVAVGSENGVLVPEFVPLDVLRWVRVTVDIDGAENIEKVAAIFGEVFGLEIVNVEGRICCARVILNGRGPVHGRLHTDFETLSANIRAMAAQVSGNRAWIEKIQLNTKPGLDVEALAQSDTPQGELLRYMGEISAHTKIYDDLGIDFSQLNAKLAGTGVSVPDGVDHKTLESARDILLTLLSDIDSEKGPA
jgi:DNA repair protein SbcD/Mre11